LRRGAAGPDAHALAEAAVVLGRRFGFDERHGQQVARLALELFDDLRPVHGLSKAVRPYLEVAALLHDVGTAVSYQRHHRHSQYLIENADLPGLTDRERALVARIARYHRRSAPALALAGLAELSPAEAQLVRRLATLLRVADALDRSHRQPVRAVRASCRPRAVSVAIDAAAAVELELWDVAHEEALFRRVFERELRLHVARGRS
jgi:exopolyphosphatase/guanosine-5'-triphosphate,3'-diphosphate pyrophosphatase